MENRNSLVMLVLFIGICLAVGGFGAIFTSGPVRDWYPMIRRPSWNPPSWIFGPVWTILYLSGSCIQSHRMLQYRSVWCLDVMEALFYRAGEKGCKNIQSELLQDIPAIRRTT